MEIKRDFSSVIDAEARTGVSRWTWRKKCQDGEIESVKLGRRVLIPNAEIDRLIEENKRTRVR